jgi:hypothetical protein
VDEALITREEMTQMMLAILDIGDNTTLIRDILERTTVGKTPKKKPDWYLEQKKRHEEFRALLEKRIERDRELAEAAKRGEKP